MAEQTWLDLLEGKKRCQLEGLSEKSDITLIITSVEKGISVKFESDYLEKKAPKTELGEAFDDFMKEANVIIDETFGRDRSLVIEQELMSENKTQQTMKLHDFFEKKISKMIFAVEVKKFVAEVSKK